jgi:uncharacterized Fe-S center protein
MGSRVYFANLRARDEHASTASKVRRLFDAAGFPDCIVPLDRIAVKLHFGERGNDSFISPVFVRQVVDRIRECGGKPFLTDTNTLYLGGRSNAVDHLETAILHGFAYAVVGAPVIIADGLTGRNMVRVPIKGRHFSDVALAGDIVNVTSMIVLSHFKGHIISGFGGAIKNLAMGCAPPAGKREQHRAHPLNLGETCIGCGKCAAACPESAIAIEGEKSVIDRSRCIGCFECMTVCPERAIDVDWQTEIPRFVERMVEYASGVVKGKEGRIGYMNFLTRITPDCDCVPWSDASIVPDIGILASTDPVAIDAASFDLVNQQPGFADSLLHTHHAKGEDKFSGTWDATDGMRQIRYAEEIGLGSGKYTLIHI